MPPYGLHRFDRFDDNKCQDAAVAVAATLNLTEPCSTGIGGDMFLLYFDAATKTVRSLNGSGRSPAASSLAQLRHDLGVPDSAVDGVIPTTSVHAVTVPGAAAGWVDCVEKFGSGKVDLQQVLAPAVRLAQEGVPVSTTSAYYVRSSPRQPEVEV
jgi:gamma-glutamyltranspeptidase/glutathione hydrolase